MCPMTFWKTGSRPGMNPPSGEALAAAASYGRRFECEFKHYPERKEGVFWKWVPAI